MACGIVDQTDAVQGMFSRIFFCRAESDCHNKTFRDEELQAMAITDDDNVPLYATGTQATCKSTIDSARAVPEPADELGGMDLLVGLRSNIRRLTRGSFFEPASEDNQQKILKSDLRKDNIETDSGMQAIEEDFANEFGAIVSLKNVAKRFRESVRKLNVSDIEEDRQIRVERCYEVYDAAEKKIIVKKMDEDLLAKFPGRQKPIEEELAEECLSTMEPSSGLTSPSPPASPRSMSKTGSLAMSPRNTSARVSDSTAKLPVVIPEDAKNRERRKRRMQAVTNWGLTVEKILKAGVADVTQLAARLRDQEWMKKNMKGCRSNIKIASAVRLRSLSVIRSAKSMAKKIAMEQVDRLDSEWNDSGLLLTLLGKDGDISDTMTLLINATRKIVASQPLLVEADAPCKVFGDINGQLRDLLLQFGTYGCPNPDEPQSYVFNGNFTGSGKHQLETIAVLFALKVAMPDKIWLLRGSNEGWNQTSETELRRACEMYFGAELGAKMRKSLLEVFHQLPVGCLISKRALVVHGGIGDGVWELGELRNLQRPLTDQSVKGRNETLIRSLMWSVPVEHEVSQSPVASPRHHGMNPPASPTHRGSGLGNKFTIDSTWHMTATFCARNSVSFIVSSKFGKECGMGFNVVHESAVAQVFSARDCCASGHDGAALWIYPSKGEHLAGMLNVRPQVLRSVTKARNDMLLRKGLQRRRGSRDADREVSPVGSPVGFNSSRRGSSPLASPVVSRRPSLDQGDTAAAPLRGRRPASRDEAPPRSSSPKIVGTTATDGHRPRRKSIDSIASFKSDPANFQRPRSGSIQSA